MDGHLFNPDDGKEPKTFGLNILIFNLLALYIEYILQSEHYEHQFDLFQTKFKFKHCSARVQLLEEVAYIFSVTLLVILLQTSHAWIWEDPWDVISSDERLNLLEVKSNQVRTSTPCMGWNRQWFHKYMSRECIV